MFDNLGFTIDPDRSIHDDKSIRFLEILGAGEWQSNLLRNGLTLDWDSVPPNSYFEDNNKSALDNLPPFGKPLRNG